MKKGLLLLLLAALRFGCWADEVRVPILGTHAAFTLTDGWKYLATTDLGDNATSYLYCYRSQLTDGQGDTALPFIRVVVKRGYAETVFDYAFERYIKDPFDLLDDYVTGLGLPKSGGLGYSGAYNSKQDGRSHRFLMVYFKEKDVMVELRLETSKATFPFIEKEFEAILQSLTFKD